MSRPHAMMPEPAPLEMPVQRFDGPPPPHNAPEPRPGINLSPDDILTRRLLLVLLTGLLATAASASVKEALLSDGFSRDFVRLRDGGDRLHPAHLARASGHHLGPARGRAADRADGRAGARA